MPIYKTPGVFIEEIPAFPPSVVPVATAVPAFIGYTNKALYQGESLINVPTKVDSLASYIEIFGTVKNEASALTLDANDNIATGWPVLSHRMFYSMQMFFNNGGRECYIVSVDTDDKTVDNTKLEGGLKAIEKEDEPTILVFPDAIEVKTGGTFDPTKYYDLYKQALLQCKLLKDRIVLIDVPISSSGVFSTTDIDNFRTGIGTDYLDYGIAYYPNLETSLTFVFDETKVTVTGGSVTGTVTLQKEEAPDPNDDSSLFHSSLNNIYTQIVDNLNARKIVLPPSSSMAGIYARVDRTRGVHIAPANVSVIGGNPTVIVDNIKQRNLNVPNDGKSINAVRSIQSRGNSVVWGARTLDGSSNEWKYLNVRRYFNYVEQAVKQSTFPFVFEPNNKNTWERLKSMIVNFLTNEWSGGALAGEKPEDAFFVNVGIGSTMNAVDILEGRLIVEIGMAVVRPAEFIILRFSHKMQEA